MVLTVDRIVSVKVFVLLKLY